MNVKAETLNQDFVRAASIRNGRRLEYLTIGWNLLEAIIAVAAGLIAGSIVLIGFGIDSIIEVSSGAILLWRLVSGEHREQLALKLVGISFLALAAYVAFDAGKSLLLNESPDESYIGIGLAALSLIVCLCLRGQNEKLRRVLIVERCKPIRARRIFARIFPLFCLWVWGLTRCSAGGGLTRWLD